MDSLTRLQHPSPSSLLFRHEFWLLMDRFLITATPPPCHHTEETIFPFPFTVNGIWSWWPFLNQMEIPIWFKSCRHDHIPFTVKGNGNIVFSVQDQSEPPFNHHDRYRQSLPTLYGDIAFIFSTVSLYNKQIIIISPSYI